MMFLSCLLACCTQVSSPKDWTEHDKTCLELAQKHCGEIYQNSPCLVKFVKIEERNYQATCGRNNR